MTCPGCGAANRPGRKFCGECGASLASACASCGTPYDPGEKFCGECGAALAASPASTAARPAAALPGATATSTAPGTPAAGAGAPQIDGPTAERRLVSVLFADLVGFTPFAEERDSEDVRETLSRYFELASDVITRYGGTVEKFIGDAVMAVWGTPIAREDDAERSVRAALELVDAVRALGPSISARVGVLTGEAAVTLGATNQGMVAGDIVNTAARLQAVAAPGTVLVGEATQRAASAAIAFEPAGEQALKGKAAPVAAFRAMRVVAEVGGRGRSDALEAPFVGRDDELRLIKDLFQATVREGRTRLVSVTGIGGIGKSRLAWEFEKYLDGIVDKVRWHRGRSPAYGEGISFWAIGEMIRGRAGLAETDDEGTTRVAIATMLETYVTDPAERRWLEPALLALLGVETGIGSEQLFGAWRTFFERLASSAPVVLVFEDLHWADPGTIDFIEHLLEWSRAIPLYIVTLARPELLERRQAWGAGHRNFTSLYLEPLDEPDMRALLAGLIPGLPETAVRAVIGRAEGIPLYAVETVRTLVADGKLTPAGDGTFTPTGDLTDLAIPETLTALIAARLDNLSPADRSLVLDAAVLGQSFTPAALAAVAGVDEAMLEPRLRALVRGELFAHETDPRSPERGQYAFVQALIREVAYNTLARKDRKTRHVAAARFFESLETDELASALAGHYLAARENATDGPEADALGAQARVALKGAAERAGSLGAHEQAVAFYEQALTVTTDLADRADLMERAGEHASAAGHHEVAKRQLAGAVDAYRELGDRPSVARTIATLGRTHADAFDIAGAVAVLEPASEEFADLGSDPARIVLDGQFARALNMAGETARALVVADRTLEAAEHADIPAVIADTLVTKGTALATLNRPIEGLGALRAGRELAEQHELSRTILRATHNLGMFLARRDPRAGHAALAAGIALAKRLGERGWIPGLVQNVAEFAIRMGDWEAARMEIRTALADDYDAADHAFLLLVEAELDALQGIAADGRLDAATTVLAGLSSPQNDSVLASSIAFVRFAEGRLEEARAGWLRAIDLLAAAAATDLPSAARVAAWRRDAGALRSDLDAHVGTGAHGAVVEADRAVMRANLAGLDGDITTAHARYREALAAWRDLGMAWDEALTGIDMAVVLGPGDPAVHTAAEAAREILVRLEAVRFIERLDAALVSTAASTSTTSNAAGAAALDATVR